MVSIHIKRKSKKSFGRRKATFQKKKEPLDRRFRSIDAYRVKPEPFPTRLQTRLKYAEDLVLTMNNSDSGASATYRGNSIFQPKYTADSRTVTGIRAVDRIYNRYLVTGCKFLVTFYGGSKNNDGVNCGVKLRVSAQNATAGYSIRKFLEQPMAYSSRISNTGKQKKTFNLFVRPWTLMGLSKLEYMANTTMYSSSMGSNPVAVILANDNLNPTAITAGDNCFIDIWACAPVIEQTSATPPVPIPQEMRAAVRIIYYVTCYDRVKLLSHVAVPSSLEDTDKVSE